MFKWTKNKAQRLKDKTAAKVKKLAAKSKYDSAREGARLAQTKERNRTVRAATYANAYVDAQKSKYDAQKATNASANQISAQLQALIDSAENVVPSQSGQDYTNSNFNESPNRR